MKKLIILSLLILSAALCHAQGSVRGKIVDTATGESMPYVNIAVYNSATQKFIKGAITNGLGAGIIVHVLVKLVRGKAKEIHPIMYLLCALMVLYFIVG